MKPRSLILSLLLFLIFISPVFPEENWNAANLSRIETDPGNFSFLILGDTRGPGSRFNKVLEKMKEEKDLAFTVILGDIVNRGKGKQYQRYFFTPLKGYNIPLLVVPGNHEKTDDLYGSWYKRHFGPLYYSFSLGDCYFVALDNSMGGNFGEPQISWLEEEIEKAGAYTYRFILMHKPLHDPRNGKNHDIKDPFFAWRLQSLFDKGGITHIFASHIHGYYEGSWGKTPFTITGGGGAPLYGSSPENFFYHYIRVDIRNDGITCTVKKVE